MLRIFISPTAYFMNSPTNHIQQLFDHEPSNRRVKYFSTFNMLTRLTALVFDPLNSFVLQSTLTVKRSIGDTFVQIVLKEYKSVLKSVQKCTQRVQNTLLGFLTRAGNVSYGMEELVAGQVDKEPHSSASF